MRETFIVKPRNGAQGQGIRLTKRPHKLKNVSGIVCQLYIENPLLIDGFKFDLRLYVLVSSIEPLRIFRYKDGLVRFATVPYQTPDLVRSRAHATACLAGMLRAGAGWL